MKRENKLVRTSINLFTDSGMNRWNLEERERTLKCVWYACACVALEKSIIITQTTMGKFELFYPLAFPHLTAKGPRALFVRIFFPKRSKRERDLRFLRLWFPLFSHPFLYWYCPSFFAFNYKDHLHSLSFSCVCVRVRVCVNIWPWSRCLLTLSSARHLL